ncbi:MAG: TonB-dependent receptor plug domain-containing protein [Deltaproteobacteria bacterium]|nr:TonB-dependent receptor plug domain-containing protein [Deltaproteobacteria bacterium]
MKYKYRNLINVSLLLTFLALVPYASAGDDEAKENQKSINKTTSAQQIEPMTVVDKPVSIRQDLELDSLTNIYRMEKSAQFGTEVFTSEDIENLEPSDIYDLLDKATGITLNYQGRRSPFNISQRGGGSYTYIIDGAVLPPSANRILYKLPVTAIEEMQIVRGSTSLTLGPAIPIGASSSGSGVNTGYVIIRTKQPKKSQAILSGSFEKNNGGHPIATNESLYLGTRIEKSSGKNGYIGILGSKMDRPSLDGWFDGRGGESGMVNAGLNINKFNINLMVYKDTGYIEMQRGIDVLGALSDVKWYYDPLKATIFSADMSMQWTPNQITLLNLFKTEYDQHENNESFASANVSYRDYSEDTEGIGIRHNARFGNTLIQIGGQMSNSTGLGGNLYNSYWKYDTTVTGWSASVEHTMLSGNLSFDGGYREDIKHIDNSSAGKSASMANDAANNNVDMAPSRVFALGAHWHLNDTYTFDGRFFLGEQGTVGDFDMRLIGDATPHREKQDRVELSLAADYVTWFKPVLTWFDIDTTNAKSASSTTYVLDGATYYYYTESDELRRGIEVLIKGIILKNTSYKVSWTRMLNNESTNNGVTTDSIGTSNPQDLYSLVINHKWNKYKANLSIKKVDKWLNSSSPIGLRETEGLGDYIKIDANIQRVFNFHNFSLTASIFGRNLRDENYSTRYVTGYYMDRGRSVGMGFSLEY